MSPLLTLPPESRQRIEAALAPREVVRWAEAPRPERSGMRALTAWIQIAFGLGVMLAGIVFGYLAMSANNEMARELPWAFTLVGGIGLILGFVDLRKVFRRHAVEQSRAHAVTTLRVLSYDGAHMRTIAPQQLRYIYPYDRRDGLGDVHIDYRPAEPAADDVEEELVFRNVTGFTAALRAIQRLAAEHGVNISDTDEEDEGR